MASPTTTKTPPSSSQRPPDIEHFPGQQIHLMLGDTGSDYSLIRSTCTDDGTVIEQSRDVTSTSPLTGAPPPLRQRLKLCKGEFCVQYMTFGPGGEWFLHGKRFDGDGESAWWDATAECSTFLQSTFQTTRNENYVVAFGPNRSFVVVNGNKGFLASKKLPKQLKARIQNVQRQSDGFVKRIALFRNGGYFISDTEGCADFIGIPETLQKDLKEKGIHDVVDVTVAGDESWVVLRERDFCSSNVCEALRMKLSNLYDRENDYRLERLKAIREYEETTTTTTMDKQHTREGQARRQDKHEGEAKVKDDDDSNNSNKKTKGLAEEDKHQEQRLFSESEDDEEKNKKKKNKDGAKERQRKLKDKIRLKEEEALREKFRERDTIALQKRQMVVRVAQVKRKGLLPSKRVTVVGFSEEPGDAVVKSVKSDGTILVTKLDDPSEQTVMIDESRRVCLYEPIQSPMGEVIKLMKATDKFEAAIAEFECQLTEREATKKSPPPSPSPSASAPPTLTKDFLEKSDSDCTLETTTSSLDSPASSSSRNTDTDGEGPAEAFPKSAPQTSKLLHDDSVSLFLPVLEQQGEYLPFDEYRCAEKIDLMRLRRLVTNLDTDKIARKEFMENMTRRRKLNPDKETRVEAALFKKLQRCHELEKVVTALYAELKDYPTTADFCCIREVEYVYRDNSSRGRLYANCKTVDPNEGRYPRNISLQSMCDDWRAPLVGSFAHEIESDLSDIQIICSLASQLQLTELIPTLIAYRDNPQEWIDRISKLHNVPEQVAKKWPDIIVAGGLHIYKSWLRTMVLEGDEAEVVRKFTCGIAAEAAVFTAEVLRHPRFRWTSLERQHLIKEGKRGASITTALMNKVIRSCETEIIGYVHRCLDGLKWQVRSKIFDALIVEKRGDAQRTLPEALRLAEKACRLQGWDIKLVERPLHGLQDKPMKTIVEARQALLEISRSILRRRRSSSAKAASVKPVKASKRMSA